MVKVTVGDNHRFNRQSEFFYIVIDFLSSFAYIKDYGFAVVIGYDVAVGGKGQTFYIHFQNPF
jgi:hypothetical protein